MYNIAIVTSKFNEAITERLYQGATDFFNTQEERINPIDSFWVPGAVELPFFAQRLAKAEKYHAILILGAVIHGETDHYDYVCQQVSYGCQRAALDNDIPIIFGVLTCQNKDLALARVGGAKGNKGYNCAGALMDTLNELEKIS